MNFEKRQTTEAAEARLEEVLRNFRSSVHAWSEAEFARPRAVAAAECRRSWRMGVAWALGCVVAVAGISAGVYGHHRQELAQRIAARAAQLQRMAEVRQAASQAVAEQPEEATEAPDETMPDAKLMAAVDKDVSQEVPSAMEPLAQLMDGNANQ